MAPIKATGESRYPKHLPSVGGGDGGDTGDAMSAQDVFIALRHLMSLEDDEMLSAFAAGVERVTRDLGPDPVKPDAPALGELTIEERQRAVDEARAVTRSRLVAWRRRHRVVTWRELRILIVGLRETHL